MAPMLSFLTFFVSFDCFLSEYKNKCEIFGAVQLKMLPKFLGQLLEFTPERTAFYP